MTKMKTDTDAMIIMAQKTVEIFMKAVLYYCNASMGVLTSYRFETKSPQDLTFDILPGSIWLSND